MARNCDQCKKAYNDYRMFTKINERDKQGKYTGRILVICRQCEGEYYKKEIQTLATRLGKAGHTFLKTSSYSGDLGALQSDLSKYLKKSRDKFYD